MWIIKSAQEPVYTVFKNSTMKGMMMKPEKNLSVVPGESRGIWAAIAKLMRRRSVIDIVERFQTKHALQEEGNEESPPVDQRRGRYGHYPLTE